MLFGIETHDPARTAVIDEKGAHSYADLCADARAMGDGLSRALVFCLCRNTYACLCGYAGFLSSGAVPLLLPADLAPELLNRLFQIYRPACVWLPSEWRGRHPAFETVRERDGYTLLRTGQPLFPMAPDLALLLTTSGSTGSPKLVRQTYRNIESNAASIAACLELDATERPVTTLPMHYTYGLSILHSHLLTGSTLLLTGASVVQKAFWDFFHAHGATSFGGVPYTYAMLKRIGFFDMELPTLRAFTQAGGKLPPELHRLCAAYATRTGKRFYVMYGQTEATARMGCLPWTKAAEKCGCMGVAIPGGAFSLSGEDGKTITRADTVGELIYRGANVTPGYAECREDLAKGDERGGVLATGDMARRDKDGFYTIVGRKKRFLKLFGSRINLDECEALIKSRFEGLDCACAGEDDHMRVYVTDAALCSAVQTCCSELTGIFHKAFTVVPLASIPRNSVGKVVYGDLPDPPENGPAAAGSEGAKP